VDDDRHAVVVLGGCGRGDTTDMVVQASVLPSPRSTTFHKKASSRIDDDDLQVIDMMVKFDRVMLMIQLFLSVLCGIR